MTRGLTGRLLAIGGVAAVIRVLYLAQYANHFPFLDQPVFDAAYYDAWARRVLSGALFPAGPFFHAPGYAWFVAAIYRLFGAAPSHAIFGQAVLGVLTTVATAGTAAILFGPETAVLAGLLMLGAGPLYFFESRLVVESWALFLLTLSGLATVAAGRRLPVAASPIERADLERAAAEGRRPPAPGRAAMILAAAGGFLAGAAAEARAVLILIPLVLVIVMLARAAGRRRPWSTTLLYTAGFVAAILPSAIHNVRSGAAAPVSTSGGLGFYLGNAAADTSAALFSGSLALEAAEADSLVTRQIGQPLAPGPASGYWLSRGLTGIAQDLPGWLGREGRKAWAFVRRYEDEPNGSPELERSRVVPLRLTALPFNFFVAAGIAGLFLAAGSFGARRGARGVLTVPVVVLAGLFTAALLLSVTPGLRLLALPPLAVFAAHALTRADLAWRSGGRRTVVLVLLAGIAFMAVSWPSPPGGRARDLRRQSRLFFETARGLEGRGRYDDAKAAYLEAVRISPRNREAYVHLSQLKLRDHDLPGAIVYLERARDASPRDFQVLNNLGILYYQARRFADADSELAAAAGLRPQQAGPLFYRGLVAKEQGDNPRAETFLRQALDRDPRFTGAYVRLIEVLLDEGDLPAARAWANRAGEKAVALPPELAARLR